MVDKNFELGLFNGSGYAPLFESRHDWMVAVYNGCPFPGYLERHNTSDEAFILMAGRAIMIVGDNGPDASIAKPVELAPFQAINIRRSVWHGLLTSREARVLIVENRDVTAGNSNYWTCPDGFLARIHLHDLYSPGEKVRAGEKRV
ncbi:MAG: ureidoglycolate lyase [Candidatus Latescibacterota bacterium]